MNQEELFDKIKDLIKKMANDYYKYTKELGIEFDDLYQEGCQAFLDKYKEYDKNRASFTTFIYPYLKLYMLRYIKVNSTVTLVSYGKYSFARNYSLENNLFYLNHGREKSLEEKLEWIDKEKNKAGWIFADYRNKFDGTDKNIIIYGHNMKNGSMFASLKDVIKEEWYNNENNKYIALITENENCKYQVFSVYQTETEEYYLQTNISNFKEFVEKIKGRSKKNFNVDIKETDSILTLSTCADNTKYRVVLHAVKVK